MFPDDLMGLDLSNYPLLNGFYQRWYMPMTQWRSVLPTSYDQGFSQEQTILLMLKVLNQHTKGINGLGDEVGQLELWIENHGIDESVKRVLEEMLSNDDIKELINQQFTELDEKIKNLSDQLTYLSRISKTHLTNDQLIDILDELITDGSIHKTITKMVTDHMINPDDVKAYILVNADIDITYNYKGWGGSTSSTTTTIIANNNKWKLTDKTGVVPVGNWFWDAIKDNTELTKAQLFRNMNSDIVKAGLDMSTIVPTVDQVNNEEPFSNMVIDEKPLKGNTTKIVYRGMNPTGIIYSFDKTELKHKDYSYLISNLDNYPLETNQTLSLFNMTTKEHSNFIDNKNGNFTIAYLDDSIKNQDTLNILTAGNMSNITAVDMPIKYTILGSEQTYQDYPNATDSQINTSWFKFPLINFTTTMTSEETKLSSLFLTTITGYTRDELDKYLISVIMNDAEMVTHKTYSFSPLESSKLNYVNMISNTGVINDNGDVTQGIYKELSTNNSINIINFVKLYSGVEESPYQTNIAFQFNTQQKVIDLKDIDIPNKKGEEVKEDLSNYEPEIYVYNYSTKNYELTTSHPGLVSYTNARYKILPYHVNKAITSTALIDLKLDFRNFPELIDENNNVKVIFSTKVISDVVGSLNGLYPAGVTNMEAYETYVHGKMSDVWAKKEDIQNIKNLVDNNIQDLTDVVNHQELSQSLIDLANDLPINNSNYISSNIFLNEKNGYVSGTITVPNHDKVDSNVINAITNDAGYLDPDLTTVSGEPKGNIVFNYKITNPQNTSKIIIRYPKTADISSKEGILFNGTPLSLLTLDNVESVIALDTQTTIWTKNVTDITIQSSQPIKFPNLLLNFESIQLSDNFVKRDEFNLFKEETENKFNQLFNSLPVINNSLIATDDLIKLAEPLSNPENYSIYNILLGKDKNGAIKIDVSRSTTGINFSTSLKNGIDSGYIPRFINSANLANQKLFVAAYLDNVTRTENTYDTTSSFNDNYTNYLQAFNQKLKSVLSGTVVTPIDEPINN